MNDRALVPVFAFLLFTLASCLPAPERRNALDILNPNFINSSPVLKSFDASPNSETVGHSVSLWAHTYDSNWDGLSFAYTVTAGGGTLSGSGSNVVYTSGALGINTVKVVVTDSRGGTGTGYVSMNATAPFVPTAGFDNPVQSLALQSDGKMIVGGAFTTYNGTGRNRIARINPDGSLDSAFNPGTGFDSTVNAVVLQTDGKVIAGGAFTTYNGTGRNRIARINPDGSLDNAFNPGTGFNGTVNAVVLQSDGKVVASGLFATYNGTGRNGIARINPDGSLDATFNPGTGFNNSVYPLALQSDGKIIAGGIFTSYDGTGQNRIARINLDGSLDTTFNQGAGSDNFVNALVLQADGKIMVGGNFTTYNGIGRSRVARIYPDGSLDNTFNPGTGFDNLVNALVLQSDGKIMAGGLFTTYNGTGQSRIARINLDGTLDTTFNPGTGFSSSVTAFVLQPDKKIMVGGLFTTYNGVTRNYICRLNADGSLEQ